MPGYVNGIPHATSTDRLDLWPTTSRNLAQWVDENLPRNDDPRLTNARPPTTHTHPISGVTGLQAALNGKTNTTDPRLSDARPPTAHTHPISGVTGLAARLAALEYDSGWRDLSEFLINGWSGAVIARRVGAVVDLRIGGLIADSATSGVFIQFPQGMRPDYITAGTSLRMLLHAGAGTYRTWTDWAGEMRVYEYAGSSALYGVASFFTSSPPPAMPPGTPA